MGPRHHSFFFISSLGDSDAEPGLRTAAAEGVCVPGRLPWAASVVQGESCIVLFLLDADADESKGSRFILWGPGSLDWLSPGTSVCPCQLSGETSRIFTPSPSLPAALIVLVFLIKESTVRNEGTECGYQGDILEDRKAGGIL